MDETLGFQCRAEVGHLAGSDRSSHTARNDGSRVFSVVVGAALAQVRGSLRLPTQQKFGGLSSLSSLPFFIDCRFAPYRLTCSRIDLSPLSIDPLPYRFTFLSIRDVCYSRTKTTQSSRLTQQSMRITTFKQAQAKNKTLFSSIIRFPLEGVAYSPSIKGARSTNGPNQPSATACFYASTHISKYFEPNTEICQRRWSRAS
jgi:hypothetical protein